MTKRALIYIREAPGVSLQAQIDACRGYAEARGWQTQAAVIDLQAAGPAYRLGLRGALDMVGAGDVEALVALSADQVSKDPVRLQSIDEMLRDKNCELHYAQES